MMELCMSSEKEKEARYLYESKSQIELFIKNGLGEFPLSAVMDTLLSIENFREFVCLKNLLIKYDLLEVSLIEIMGKGDFLKKNFDEFVISLNKNFFNIFQCAREPISPLDYSQNL